MIRPRRGNLLLAVVLLAGLVLLHGQAVTAQNEPSDHPPQTDSAKRLQEMRIAAVAIRAMDKSEAPIELVREPLFRFDDGARGYPDGTMWALGKTGRPRAIFSIARIARSASGMKWLYEFTSISDTPLSMESPEGWRWTPVAAKLASQPIPGDPPVAKAAAIRKRQMKQLARQFAADETYKPRGEAEEQTYRLRLLPQPVYRYRDADAGVVEGALFLFAFGTNPEIFLFIECHVEEGGDMTWHYILARSSSARLAVKHGDQIIWKREKMDVGDFSPLQPYHAEGGTGKNLPQPMVSGAAAKKEDD